MNWWSDTYKTYRFTWTKEQARRYLERIDPRLRDLAERTVEAFINDTEEKK